MRGQVDPQQGLFSYFSPESRIPAEHPLRAIKAKADAALKAISRDLDQLYSANGRPSIAPERLLKGQLLIALYSVRPDRAFCEQLDYNVLFAGSWTWAWKRRVWTSRTSRACVPGWSVLTWRSDSSTRW